MLSFDAFLFEKFPKPNAGTLRETSYWTKRENGLRITHNPFPNNYEGDIPLIYNLLLK